MRKITNSSKTQNKSRRHPVHVFVMMCLMIMLGVTNATAQTYGGGNGTEGNPYLLSTKAHLTTFFTETFTNGKYNDNTIKVYFRMTGNIDMENTSNYTASININHIMKNVVFDGNGYTIYNITNTYVSPITFTQVYGTALFPKISESSITNLTLSDFKFYSNFAIGGLVGLSLGTSHIENCHVKTGEIYGLTEGSIGAMSLGGLVGNVDYNGNITIKDCSVASDVKIIFWKEFSGVSNVGRIAGGLIGEVSENTNVEIYDCLVSTDLKSNVNNNHTEIGGLIGSNLGEVIMARVVLPADNVYTPNRDLLRGTIVGDNDGLIARYSIYIAQSGIAVGGGSGSSTGNTSSYSEFNGISSIYNLLERVNNTGGLKASDSLGNQSWGCNPNYPYNPILTKTNYVIRLIKGTNISNMSSSYGGKVDGNYYYTRARNNLEITSSASLNNSRVLKFYIDNELIHTTIQGENIKTYTYQPDKDGTIKVEVIQIPYISEKSLKGNFNQWENKVTLNWTGNNPNNISGKWYIYKRENNTSGTWTRYTGENVVNGTKNYSQSITINDEEWDKKWDYTISFISSTTDPVPGSPYPYDSANVVVNTAIDVPILSLLAEGLANGIKITASVPTQLTNSTAFSYAISRKADGGSFGTLITGQSFDGTGKIEYFDEASGSSCVSYVYRLEITAFNRTFSETSNPANLMLSTNLTSLKTTKGEYSNKVRLEWETNKTSTETTDRYKVFRKVATNPDDVWTEMATINTNEISYIYIDDQTMPGVYYKYRVTLYQVCDDIPTELVSKEDIGFSQSLGAVSGRVTYGSGVAVKDVAISLVRNDLQTNESQYHSLRCSGSGLTFDWLPEATYYNNIVNGDFTFQFWINPDIDMAPEDMEIPIAAFGNLLAIYLIPKGEEYQIALYDYNNNYVMHSSQTYIKPSRFTHIAIVHSDNNIICHIINDEDLTDIQIESTTMPWPAYNITLNSDAGISMGYSFSGYIDECRLWSRALSVEEIRKDFNRMLIGSEEKLKAYWTFDEGLDGDGNEAGYFFDISCVGTIFNRNHGRHNLTSSTVIPTADQLALKGFTDANGNYQIRGIPFSGTGSSYDVVPSLGVHQFNPTSHLRIISNNSLMHNGVDFTDISTFDVSGTVVYEGGNYPVLGCNFEIDGAIQTNSDGSAVTNNEDGSFSIKVPIGEHTVRVVKTGHTFANDGYLTMPEGGYNSNVSGVKFFDQTRVKLIGRVVGGLTDHNKPLGFGETVNNTGASTITLTTARQAYDIQSESSTETFYHNEGQWKKPDGLADDSTTVTYNKKNITIEISPITGEFVALVYPEVYNIGEITAPGYIEKIYDDNESIDLSKSAVPSNDMLKTSVRTWQDSILIQRPGQIDYYEPFENSDTVRYNAEWKTYYQAVPTFKATQLVSKTPVPYFGEIDYHVEDKDQGIDEDITLWNETDGYLFGDPVYIQGKKYTLGFEAYEQYINRAGDEDVTFLYPVNQGTITLTNSIRNNTPSRIELDSIGKATHTFVAGAPDLTTGKHSIFGTIAIGSASYYWDQGQLPMEVWHLGDKTTGTDFMTAGPNEITTILRDPPGSLSSSFIEKGTTIVTTAVNEIKEGAKEAMNLKTSLGPKIKSFIGIGGGVILESEIIADASIGINAEQIWTSSEEASTSVTFTERFETSDDPLYVGYMGDVFIGNSTNIQYGLTRGISIYKNYIIPDPDDSDELVKAGDYSIAPSVSLAYGQTFDTRFAFTQVDIEGIMIPKWQDNMRMLLKPVGFEVNTSTISRPTYVSKLPVSDENFGKLNTDKDAFGEAASNALNLHDGPSYKIYFPDNYDMSTFTIDSIMWFNNQINGWISVLAQNEKEKVEMLKIGNYSFGGGAAITLTETETSSKKTTSTFHWMLNPTIGLTTGGDVMGIGLELSTTLEYVYEEDETEIEEKITSITSGFVLKEEGDNDQISVDYGMTKSGTIAFKTMAGRTSCPYEDAYVTKYYQPGQHVLNEATMQIEVPKIDINGPNQVLNVPANKTATFLLEMKNESEISADVWYQLIVDEKTNPHGAELKIDGGSIGNGRTFLVNAGSVLNKTLTVGKGTADSCYIGLILRSQCQHDPTDFLPDIADTTYISVRFIPGCSDVNISEPYNNWIVNTETDDSLRIVLDGFQRDYENFGYIKLEYRNVSSPTWSSLMNFYADPNIQESADDGQLIDPEDQNIVYFWRMKNVPDASYELRATAVCVNTDANGAILSIISESPSQVITGQKDLTRPEALGAPTPVNGILSIGDEISITFNEEIQTSMLIKDNFSISGVLNGSEIKDPTTGLYFTGTGSAYTELPIAANGSFSIETWFKRTNNTAGTLFAYGEGNNFISLSLDETGHAIVQIGDSIQTSIPAMSNTTNTWKYIGLAYNRSESTVYVYGFQDSDPTIALFVSKQFVPAAPTLGKLYVGNTNDNSNGFKGAIARTHFYNVAHTEAEMTLVKGLTKSGTEPNLIGLWEMSEAEGYIAKDKARSRNLIVDTDWYIYPSGKSLLLNGTNQYAAIPSEDFGFRYFDDFTIEMQFRGTTQGEATILSVSNSAYLEFDSDNKFVLSASGNTQVLTSKNLLDGNWHHVALSVKRGGMTTAIIDGVATSTFSSSIFGDLVGGGFYYLGVHYFANTSTGFFEYTKYFNGNIDEVRVWNTALSTSVVNQNRKYKLVGDEVGLITYYPFEAWEELTSGIITVSENHKDVVTPTRVLQGEYVMNNVAAAIIDYPGVTKIASELISFVASSNKIVLTIDEEFYKIEGTTLEISVENVLDLRGNISKTA
ncbi:LamG domain-containing protein, partial [Bacteroidales bacterium OttesenSCG-928-L14]|nr:LamG domain-containing protein [Bacteroidales bacterium OttesenSCG-928-L14]